MWQSRSIAREMPSNEPDLARPVVRAEHSGRQHCRTQDNLKHMDSRRVLVVEDDSAIRQGIVDALKFAGFDVIQARNGNEGLAEALRANFDLMLLDLVLPGVGGFDILKATREARPTLPVIILTARGEEADRVEGLRMGADDYVVKPFSVRELLARVEAVLRCSPERPNNVSKVRFDGGTIDLD